MMITSTTNIMNESMVKEHKFPTKLRVKVSSLAREHEKRIK